MSCAIGTKYKAERSRLMSKHTLKAVFSMPDDIFYGNNASTNVCVMIWEAGKPHDSSVSTFFGFCKDDGFVKRKKLGRIDAFGKWDKIKNEWLKLYREREEKEAMSTKAKVKCTDEWLCEAYMKTDFSKLTDHDFEMSILDYLSYRVKNNPERVFSQTYNASNSAHINKDIIYDEFKVEDIFIIQNGKGVTKDEIADFPGAIEAIQSGADNNAVLGKLDEEYCNQSKYKIIREQCLSVARSGTSGYVAYHETPCVIGDSAKALLLKDKSKASIYVYIYLRTVLMANKYKYAYGRKVTEKKYYKDTIVLPITKVGVPDWNYMEDYIKQLPYGDRL